VITSYLYYSSLVITEYLSALTLLNCSDSYPLYKALKSPGLQHCALTRKDSPATSNLTTWIWSQHLTRTNPSTCYKSTRLTKLWKYSNSSPFIYKMVHLLATKVPVLQNRGSTVMVHLLPVIFKQGYF